MAPWRRAPLALVLALGGPLSVPAQPAREPEFTMVDFADDQELARHLPPEDHLFTSRRLAADLVDIFGGTGTAAAWTVLELGSAHGHTTEVLSALFARVIAVDLLTSAHRAAAARGAGARGNVVWLTLDAYRDPWLSLLAGNDIQVAFVDALHSRDAVAADLRACAQLPGLRYVLVHDFNFADIRQAVAASARSFALVAALGEARRIPLHERRDRAEAPKFPEAVLLRPAGGLALRAGGRAADEAEPEVAAAVARFLQDPQLAAMASRAGDAIAAEAPPGPTAPAFPELCGAT
ncbi:unnamed protein product [Prorocentrum cordatum]|uniref:Class I SAM-dependent methyltransferase n=1 Tax=Prorocentrum cordatum TaxID=2364126 RepID=A0ABN9V055_9DINO|nr:unnamed protein product [Polarella glacialis]